MRTHIRPERVLECPTSSCPFVTEYRHHLELHLRNHLNSRPIRCPICPYRCAVSSMLASHLKSHTKVHRFRCSVCRFSSKFSNALKRHLIEKGHARGYVLNPDGSIPDGGAVPFEPGSPSSTRLRQKAAGAKPPATATKAAAAATPHRNPADVKAELTGVADVWTTTSPEMSVVGPVKPSWRPLGDDLPVNQRSQAVMGPSVETQCLGVPPPPPLTTTRSLYACVVCGLDAGGYVELARHMMTSHYSAMTSSAAATPLKRRWPADDDERCDGLRVWTPPSLPAPQLNHRHRPSYDLPDVRREFLQPVFPTSSTPSFQRPPVPATSYLSASPGSAVAGSYRGGTASPTSTALGSLGRLRAELDALRSLEAPRLRADNVLGMTGHDLGRMKSEQVDTTPRRTVAPQSNLTDVASPSYWHKTTPHAPVPATLGLPLDLSRKTPTPLLQSAVKFESKRSRRKGKAFKVDADRFNSACRDDDDLADNDDPLGERSSVNCPWRGLGDHGAAAAERARQQVLAGTGPPGDRHFALQTASRCTVETRWSDGPPVTAAAASEDEHQQVLAAGEPKFTGDRYIIAPTAARSAAMDHRWSEGADVAVRTVEARLMDGPGGRTAAAASDDERRRSSSAFHECGHCGLGFRDGELFAMHMDFHGRPDPFTCNFCGAATGNQVEFFLHVAHAPHNVRPVYVV